MAPPPRPPGWTAGWALNDASELADGALPDDVPGRRASGAGPGQFRRSLSADHTVVGFFGATGSGKSSLFNAVSGEEIATAAASGRRPRNLWRVSGVPTAATSCWTGWTSATGTTPPPCPGSPTTARA